MSAFLVAQLVGQQQHTPPGGAIHLVMVAGVVVTALAIFGVSRWRRRGDSATDEEQFPLDRSADSTRSSEDE